MLPLLTAWVQSLVRELRSQKQNCMARKEKKSQPFQVIVRTRWSCHRALRA